MSAAHSWQARLAGDPAIRRILFMKWSALGDIAIASAALEDLHRAFPDAELHLNTLPPWQRLFEDDPRVARIIAPELRGARGRLHGTVQWLRGVRAGRYDLIVDLQSNDHSRTLLGALMLSGARVPWRAGHHRRFPYNLAPPPRPPPVHAHQHAAGALGAAGVACETERPVLAVSAGERASATALLAKHAVQPGSYVVLLPGCQAAGYLKRWGAARYAELARRLHLRGVARVLVLGGPDEVDECAAIERACGRWLLNLCGQTRIRELIPLCEQALAVVANDTGTAHVAAAAGRPMTVICGPTDPRRVKPLGPAVVTVQAELPCRNCYRKHCAHHSCMRLVAPESVLATLPLLAGQGASGGDPDATMMQAVMPAGAPNSCAER